MKITNPIIGPVEFFSDGFDLASLVGVELRLAVFGGMSAVKAATGLTIPKPYSLSRPGSPLSIAVAVIRWITSGAFRSGNLERMRAATPAMIAVAGLVPVPLE